MSYADLVRLKEMLSILDEDADDMLQRALDTATSVIDQYCGRTFSVSAAPTARYFYPSRTGVLPVVDLYAPATVKIDTSGNRTFSTTLAPSDYELRPLDGPPYQEIRSWPQANWVFQMGQQVEVTGTWGYGSGVPAGVEEACLILGARYYKRGEAPFGVLQSVDLGQFTRISQEDPDVKTLLAPFVLTTQQDWIMV